jgi:hypothetical protein
VSKVAEKSSAKTLSAPRWFPTCETIFSETSSKGAVHEGDTITGYSGIRVRRHSIERPLAWRGLREKQGAATANEGIQRFARETTDKDHPPFLLKGPLQVGTTWQDEEGEDEITAVDKTVTVPAGAFSHCLRERLLPALTAGLGAEAPA